MGENEQGELISYTVFFVILALINLLLIIFIQFSQVQTAQHNVEAVLSKNGGYTNAAIKSIAGTNDIDLNSTSTSIIPIKGVKWVYLSKTTAKDADAWKSVNGSNPKNSDGDTNHWNLKDGTTERQNTIIPYKVVFFPAGTSNSKNGLFHNIFSIMQFSGTTQSNVYTGTVE